MLLGSPSWKVGAQHCHRSMTGNQTFPVLGPLGQRNVFQASTVALSSLGTFFRVEEPSNVTDALMLLG